MQYIQPHIYLYCGGNNKEAQLLPESVQYHSMYSEISNLEQKEAEVSLFWGLKKAYFEMNMCVSLCSQSIYDLIFWQWHVNPSY